MRYIVNDNKYNFKYAFDTETGAYIRTGILDEEGNDTGVDPFTKISLEVRTKGVNTTWINDSDLVTSTSLFFGE